MPPDERAARMRRRVFWIVVVALVVVPVPTGEPGIYGDLGNPPLFWLFDWINQFLPENY